MVKDLIIEAIEEVRKEDGMFFDEETGEFFYKSEEGAVSFTTGNLLAMLMAMVLGK